jgi:hypothetical protein
MQIAWPCGARDVRVLSLGPESFTVGHVNGHARRGAALSLGALAVLLLGGSSDPTRDAAPPPSPKFHAPTAALFADDFSSGLGRWKPDQDGVWSVRHGMLRADLPDEKQLHSLVFAGDESWSHYAVDLDVCGMRGVDKGVVVRVQDRRGLGVDLRGPGYQDLKLHVNELPIGRASVINGNGVWHHLRVEIRGTTCRVWVDGDRVLEKKVPLKLPAAGGIALAAYTGGVGQCTVYYDNVVVTPLATSETASAP